MATRLCLDQCKRCIMSRDLYGWVNALYCKGCKREVHLSFRSGFSYLGLNLLKARQKNIEARLLFFFNNNNKKNHVVFLYVSIFCMSFSAKIDILHLSQSIASEGSKEEPKSLKKITIDRLFADRQISCSVARLSFF